MLTKIKTFFEQFIAIEELSEAQKTHSLNLAVAAIMLEMVGMDSQVKPIEMDELQQRLALQLSLPKDEIEQLADLAKQELSDAVDYHQFTRLINHHFKATQKIEIIESLWRIAYADSKLDSFEEHFLRKISDLLFVPHSEFIKAKLRVQPN